MNGIKITRLKVTVFNLESLVYINFVGLAKRNAELRSRDVQQQRAFCVLQGSQKGRGAFHLVGLWTFRFGDKWHAKRFFGSPHRKIDVKHPTSRNFLSRCSVFFSGTSSTSAKRRSVYHSPVNRNFRNF